MLPLPAICRWQSCLVSRSLSQAADVLLFDATTGRWDKGARGQAVGIVCPEAITLNYGEADTMRNQEIKFRALFVAAGFLLANSAYAMDLGKMMNPSKWMGGNKNNDRYDDYRGGPGYGYPGGPPGYGYGGAPGYGPAYGPGYGYGAAPGYGARPAYGYGGGPGYYGAAPGYAAPTYGAPAGGSDQTEIMRLQERIRQLESGVR